MQVQVISSVNEACSTRFHHKTAIIVDVLRSTSTIITALASGATGVIPIETVMEARAAQHSGDLLGGERFGRTIPGFDLGNSPDDYTRSKVKDRRIIMTTTNGTRAFHKSTKADYVLTAALLNASACAKAAIELRRDVVILCAGSHDEFAIEDGLCAGLMLDKLQTFLGLPLEMCDFSLAMLSLYRDRADHLKDSLQTSSAGKRLIKLGLKRDVETCSLIDIYKDVPRLYGDTLSNSFSI